MLAPPIFPEWLPPVVAEEAESLAQERPEDEELLRRLATDPRMESVWREIKEHNSSEHIDWERWSSNERRPTGLSNEDIALKLTFRCAFFHALHVIHEKSTIATIAEHKALIDSYKQQAARLRTEAAKLRERGDASRATWIWRAYEEHAEAVERAAARCEKDAAELLAVDPAHPDTPIIERDKGWRREMDFADMLATQVMQPLYGTPLYGTVATVTNVALLTRRSVEARHVSDWLKRLRKPRPLRIRTPTAD
jgi:hypothetical protein